MDCMFSYCSKVTTIFTSNGWTNEKVSNEYNSMFVDCYSLVGGAYNLKGVRVDNPSKGIYIVNGKKVVRK